MNIMAIDRNKQNSPRLGQAKKNRQSTSIRAILAISLASMIWLPRAADAGWLFLNSNSFGPNTSVIADLGAPSYITGCTSGVNDFFGLASVNIFIVPQGEPGAGAISDVSNAAGIPNAVVTSPTAGFVGEVLGNTAPAGYLISGDYAVVMDECQNNKYDPGQDFYGAEFSVQIPSDITGLEDSAFAAQLNAAKAEATNQAQIAAAAQVAFDAMFQSFMLSTLISAATDPLDFLLFACTNVTPPQCSVSNSIQGLIDLRLGMLGVMLTNVLHYQGIAADPPDLNYTLLPVLDSGLKANIKVDDPMMDAAFKFGEKISEVVSLTGALLNAMERYQGADQQGNGEWAFVQARQMEDYARALSQAIPRANAAFQEVASAVTGKEGDILTTMQTLHATQQRVATSGFTPEEILRMRAMGWSDEKIASEKTNYLTYDFDSYQGNTMITDLAAQMAASEASAVAAFGDFADTIVAAQTHLQSQLRLPFPDADAGGPYVVNEGVAISLDAFASSHPDLANSDLTFSWDFNLDGVFDDASGESPNVTFDQEFDGLIGVKVSSPSGYFDVAYARLTVNNVNSSPQIDAFSPPGDVSIPSDGSQVFSATVSDPDSDPVSYAWFLDDIQVSTANTYTYNASVPQAGEHVVRLTVSDGSSNSLDVSKFWGLRVIAPDNDGDGYPSNVDCDDSDPAVNPGATEIDLNGIDDDCNPATPDNPDVDNDGYDYTVDCDDNNAAINPGATEVCNLLDDNCDGAIDEGFDADGDGFSVCASPAADCDDSNPDVYPGATEVCNLIDDNCDGVIDENFDVDGDGVTSCGGDCDDFDNNNYPGNAESCDLQDNNCDGVIDEGFDLDGDGVSICAPTGVDCDDADSTTYPGAPELCDLKDNNCDGAIDEGVNDDLDGDGQSICAGDCDDTDPNNYVGNTEICDNQDNNCDASIDEGFDLDGDGITICSLPVADCDDADGSNFPGNSEICDLQDNNCDSVIDEGFDLDGDSFSLCSVPVADCDDNEAASFPGNAEICDGIDNNCDGQIDEGFDADGDGVSVCATPVADCDDSNADVYPGRPEVFHNGRNDDCDAGTADDYADTFIIVPDDNGRIYYASSNGDGTWTNYKQVDTLSGAIRGAAIADYDNDGDLDFVLGSPSGHTLTFYLYRNDGADNFTRTKIGVGNNTNSYQMDMAVGDFNHDGNMDFLSNSNWTYQHRGMGDGKGNFVITTVNLNIGNGRGMDSADFDHDGNLDFVRTTYSSGQIVLFKGDGSGGFTNAGVIGDPGSDPYGVTAADFNNDGHVDVLANNGGNGDAYFYAGNGDGSFQAGVYTASVDFNNHGAYDNYDFNRDGNQDLVASSYSSRKIYYYPGNGDGTFGPVVVVNPSNTAGYILGISAPPSAPPLGDPVPFYTPNPYTGVKGDTVNFDASFSTDDGTITDFSWDFGDSSTGAGSTTSHTFPNIEDEFSISLQVTDDDGKVVIGTGLVTLVGDAPVADAGGPYIFGEDFATAGIYTVPLDGSASVDDGVDPLQYLWDLGDGFSEDFSSGLIDSNIWQSAGATVSAEQAVVTGSGSWGAKYLVSGRSFARNSTETVTFTGKVGTVVNPTVMWGLKNTGSDYSYTQFTYAIYFNNNSWIYIYEDGSSRGNKVQYTEGQDYEVRIDLKPSAGASYYFRPVGASNWTLIYNSNHSSAQQFRFGATVNSGAIRLDDFDRSLSSTKEKPTVVYNSQDTFDVSLTVTDIAAQSDTNATTVQTVAGDRPVANAGGPYQPGEANASCGNYSVVFDGSGSTDDSGRIYRYDWDFGDGNVGSGVSPSHTFNAGGPVPGNFTVTLTVTDHALQTNLLNETVAVNPQVGNPPVAITANYNVDETAANAGFWTVNFNATSSTDDFGFCDYVWDFGDGAGGTGPTPSHQYAATGTYNATLTVRDNALQSHQTSFTVTVSANDPPSSDNGGPYSVDEAAAQNGQWTVNFDASSSTDDFSIWKYSWDFGDGNTGTGVTPTHNYTAAGTYDVTLTVYDQAGQTTSSTTQVTVNTNGAPVAEAGPNQITERGFPVTLDASASTDDFVILSYLWDFDLPAFSEDFSESSLNSDIWSQSGVSVNSGEAIVTGGGSWSNRYLVTKDTFVRTAGDSYTGRIQTEAGGNRYVMWGLKNTGSNYSYTQFYYAIYFNNNSIQVYESGSYRGAFGSFTDGTSYDVRIDVKADAGALYYYRETGATDWTLLRDSTYSNASSFKLGATVHSGVIHLDDFKGPAPTLARNNRAIAEISYESVGSYQPAVTVTDHALQTDTDSTTITVIEGAAPVAKAGGPYLTNEDVPTRFNGRASTDDFGIKFYNWDFGDGTTLTSRNPFADHRYTAAGSYTATLTVTDFAGHSHSDSTTVNVSADPVVAAVPWRFSGGIEVPHDTWSGKEVVLKAVAWSLQTPLSYEWDFGDGSAKQSGTVSNKRFIQAKHTYNGVEGKPFIATIKITDANGRTATDQYLLRVRAKSLDIETNVAIDDGLWYLHGRQTRSETAQWLYGTWNERYQEGATASAIQAFEINGHLELGDVREDPYVETVSRGLHSLFSLLTVQNISAQTYGDPDSNGNGIGISVNTGRLPIYQGGMVMDAIASSGSANTFADTGPSGVVNRTYKDIAQDMIDQYAWGQYDSATVGGGWRYYWNQHPDNSAAQWGAIGVLALKHVFDLDLPQWAKDRNNAWLDYSFSGTGFGYTGKGAGQAQTPSGMVQMPMDEKDTSDPRWIASESTVTKNWANWYKNTNNYYALFALTKAMRLALPNPIVNLTGPGTYNGLDWFSDPVSGVRRTLIDDNFASGNGSFAGASTWVSGDLADAWGVIMLTPTLFVQPPVADAGSDRVWGVDVPLTFDASGSFHQDPFRSIVKYEWDIDGDGVYDSSSSDPTFTYTFSSSDYPEASLPQTVVVRLRVTDNNDPAKTDTDTVNIIIAVPPHPPVAVIGGPYNCTAGLPCKLDGSASFDIDPTDFITSWEWDLDNDGQYDDANGAKPEVIFPNAGLPFIGLRVVDNAVLNDQDGDGVQDPEERLDNFDFTSVTVNENQPPQVDIGGPYTVNEGGSILLDGSASSDPDGNPISYAWDLDNDGLFDDSSAETVILDAGLLDDGSYPVGLQVSDSLLDDSITTLILVVNVAPSVDVGPDASIDEGTDFIQTGHFTDPGQDSWTATVDYGDGSSKQVLTLNADKSFDLSHNYGQNGNYTVTVTVTDDDGGVGSDSLQVSVNDLAPVAALVGDSVLNEGQAGSYDASGSSSSSDAIVSYEWDWQYDGSTFNPSGDTGATQTHVWMDNGNYIVAVQVTDADGSQDIATLAVTVNDLAPIAKLTGDTVVIEGQSGNYDASGSTSDPDAIFSYEWDWNYDGSTFVPSGLTGVSQTYTWAGAGSYNVAVRVTDDDGSTDIAVLGVTVSGSGPVAQISGDDVLNEGETGSYDANGSFVSSGVITSYEWDWEYDGGTFNPSGNTGATQTHVWLDNGNYIVAVRVTDDDGSQSISTLPVIVKDLGPTAVLVGDASLSIDQTGNYDASGSTSSPDVIVSYEWDWAYDGSGFAPSVDSGATQSHSFANAGTFLIAVRVTDDDGSQSVASMQVDVVDVVVQPELPIADLSARSKSEKIDLVWTPVNEATGYNVYRSTTQGGPYTLIAQNYQCDYCAYADFGLINGTTYYYVVTWLKGNASSTYSNEASATPSGRTRR